MTFFHFGYWISIYIFLATKHQFHFTGRVLMGFRSILFYMATGMTCVLLTWTSLSQGRPGTFDFGGLDIFFNHECTPCQEAFHVITPSTFTALHPREQDVVHGQLLLVEGFQRGRGLKNLSVGFLKKARE